MMNVCDYCAKRSWECEEGYISYPSCKGFVLEWYAISDEQKHLIEKILMLEET